jgi:uncharacterized membrane protein
MAYIGRQPSYGAFEKQDITPDGSTTTFALNYSVGSSSSILVSVAGVVQEPETGYSVTSGGSNIQFSAAPAAVDNVYVVFLGLTRDIGAIDAGAITNQTELAESPANNDFFLIYDSSSGQLKKVQNTYIGDINSKTELAERAATNDEFLIYDTSASTIKKIQASNVVSATVSRTGTGDGSTTDFTVTDGVTVAQCIVSINGVIQTPTTDYTISGTTLTFGTAPEASDAIRIRELPA